MESEVFSASILNMTSVITRHFVALAELCVRFRVARLAVFGSATTDEYDPANSDVDLVVEFVPLSPVERADAYFGLLEALEELLGVPVDLLELEPIKNPYLKRSIEETQVVVYEAA